MCWDFPHCSRADSITNRTAVYGSVRKVVWEGRRSDPSPYPDQECLRHVGIKLGCLGSLKIDGGLAALSLQRIGPGIPPAGLPSRLRAA